MRALIAVCLLAGSVAAADPAPGPDLPFTPPHATRIKLESGLTLLVVSNHRLPVVTLRLVVPGAGSAADPPGRGGLAAFTADLVDEGSGARGALEISQAAEALGGAIESGVDADSAFVEMSTLSKKWAPALDLFAEVVTSPRFDAAEAARVHGDRMTAIELRPDRPHEVGALRLAAALFGEGSRLGHAPEGEAADFAKLGREDAAAFYRDAWDPARSVLVVVGDVDAPQVAADVKARLEAWRRPRGRRPKVMPAGKPSAARLIFVERPGAEQSDVVFGMRSRPRADARSYALEVLVNAWGGGFTGRLTQILRERKGYLYHVYPELVFHPEGSVYAVLAPLFTPVTGEGMKEILAMIDDLRANGVVGRELGKAQLNLIRDLPDRFESNSETASAFGDLFRLGLPDDWYAQYARRISAVTSDELKKVAREELKKVTFVVVGDPAKVRPIVEALGLGKPEVWGLDGKRR